MINNKQVNIWRGDDEPPTIYHIWIKKVILQEEPLVEEWVLNLFDGTTWVPFVNNADVAAQVVVILERLENLEEWVNNLTINGKKITDKTLLTAEDINAVTQGKYIKENDNVASALMTLDKLFRTQIIE